MESSWCPLEEILMASSLLIVAGSLIKSYRLLLTQFLRKLFVQRYCILIVLRYASRRVLLKPNKVCRPKIMSLFITHQIKFKKWPKFKLLSFSDTFILLPICIVSGKTTHAADFGIYSQTEAKCKQKALHMYVYRVILSVLKFKIDWF